MRKWVSFWWMAASLALGSNPGAGQEPQQAGEDAEGRSIFLSFLRQNFEDIHEVSMRFHMVDPSIGGVILLRMTWEDGNLVRGEVVDNQTGSQEEGLAMLEAMRGWTIPDLEGPSTFSVPLRIKLVGSDHPEFRSRAILTGSVKDSSGRPLHRARIVFESESEGMEVPPASSNREGIFVRTLIPPGRWNVSCWLEGYETVRMNDISLVAGQHQVLHFQLREQPD